MEATVPSPVSHVVVNRTSNQSGPGTDECARPLDVDPCTPITPFVRKCVVEDVAFRQRCMAFDVEPSSFRSPVPKDVAFREVGLTFNTYACAFVVVDVAQPQIRLAS